VPFPPGFLWGTATAAYQIEGGVGDDGRGASIWDAFSHTPGTTERGETGDVACDHYHRAPDDVDLMADLGLKAYRFSVAWPRLFPDGGGRMNRDGLAFYDRLVDRLLERDIVPMATLYHWDLPQTLQAAHGGWADRDTAARFADYAAAVFDALGDRVQKWVTINEPWVAAFIGHLEGRHAPGVHDLTTAVTAAHHLLLGHAGAVSAFRSSGRAGEIGISLNLNPVDPASDRDADERAAVLFDGHLNRWFLDAILRGTYPTDLVDHYTAHGADLEAIRPGDLEAIARPTDFLGINTYFRNRVAASPDGLGWVDERAAPGDELTTMGWGVDPSGLFDLLARLRADYPAIPIHITENGIALDDAPGPDGRVDDPRRIDYLERHIDAAERAIAAGTDLRGYFVWTLLDNFEWAAGYRPRFGIVYTDFVTQERIPKSSAAWYGRLIANEGRPG
jgi:beta-glucosidase